MFMYKDIARCKPCKFRVGSTKAVFYVHPAAIAGQSKALQDLTLENAENSMKNSVTLEDVDEETFVRFVEYLYTGEYAAARPTARVQSAEASAAEDSDEELTPATSKADHNESVNKPSYMGWGFGAGFSDAADCEQTTQDSGLKAQHGSDLDAFVTVLGQVKKKQKKKTSLLYPPATAVIEAQPVADENVALSAERQAWETFKALTWPLAKMEVKGPEYYARSNETSDEDYSQVFLSHARLHVFACVYDIGRLKALTLNKLHKVLVAFTIFEDCAQDIAELLLYSYSEHGDDSVPELRKLVTDYVACNVKKLMKDASFKSAVQGTEASFALLALVVERM